MATDSRPGNSGSGNPGSGNSGPGSSGPDRPSPYPRVADRPDFDAIEREVLAYWADDGTFEASVKARSGSKEFVFYDGPPFANGLPHYGHLLTGYVKDAIPRYKTMRGWRVERRFGWDCHGLPAEMEAVKELELPTASTSRSTASAASTITAEPPSCVIRASGSAT